MKIGYRLAIAPIPKMHQRFVLATNATHRPSALTAGAACSQVALAAIQGLNQKLEELTKAKDAAIAELRRALVEFTQLVKAQNSE